MKIRFVISIFLVLMVALPAFAYGDPTGGMLFQMLTPILAMLWGLWMVFANAIRRGTANFVRKFRNEEASDDPTADDQSS